MSRNKTKTTFKLGKNCEHCGNDNWCINNTRVTIKNEVKNYYRCYDCKARTSKLRTEVASAAYCISQLQQIHKNKFYVPSNEEIEIYRKRLIAKRDKKAITKTITEKVTQEYVNSKLNQNQKSNEKQEEQKGKEEQRHDGCGSICCHTGNTERRVEEHRTEMQLDGGQNLYNVYGGMWRSSIMQCFN